jgi:integration host factor subunit beta
MQRKDIALKIAAKCNTTDVLAKEIVNEVFKTIIDALIAEGRLELRNFGVFTVKIRKPRKARNPKTGQEVMLPLRKVIVFKPGFHVKKRLSGK